MRSRTRLLAGLVACFAIACGPGEDAAESAGESGPAPDAAPGPAAEVGAPSVLDGTSWRLTSFAEGDPVPADAEITLAFGEGGGVSGKAACNRYTGSAEIGPAGADATIPLAFGPLAMTRMACPPPLMDLEARYASALEGASLATVAPDRLALGYATDAGEAAELVFEPAPPEAEEPPAEAP